MSGYSVFSRYYDALTRNVAYDDRCGQYCTLLARHGAQPHLVLDLACGTGSFTLELARRGMEPIGVDASPTMLAEAQQKAAQAGQNILFLCQPMQRLDLYGTVEAAFCTLDSINHLTRPAWVQETFRRVALFLEPGGLFLFDANTPYKHQAVLGNQTYVMETDAVYCVWQNELQPDRMTVQFQLDFFEKQGGLYARRTERFRERAYTDEEVRAWLEAAGLACIDCVAERTLAAPDEHTERVIYVARSMKEKKE